MPLSFSGTGIVLIFWKKSLFACQFLSTTVTVHLVSRHTEPLGFVGDSKATGFKVIEVVTYFQPLKARPELGVDNFATDFRISLAEIKLELVSTIAS